MKKYINCNNNRAYATIAHMSSHKVVLCTIAYENGWWAFIVPNEGVHWVIDSRQARSLVGMVINTRVEVDQEDVDEWAEYGPRVVSHVAIPHRLDEPGDGDALGDASGNDEPDGSHELESREDDIVQRLTRGEGWKRSVAQDYWTSMGGIQSRATGNLGDERTVRDIDRNKEWAKAAIESLQSRRRVPAKRLAEMKALLKALEKSRHEYVARTGKSNLPRYHLFYTPATKQLNTRIRMTIQRAIESLSKSLPMASASLLCTVRRGARLGYEPDPRWRWTVLPFDRKSLPHLVGQADREAADKKGAA